MNLNDYFQNICLLLSEKNLVQDIKKIKNSFLITKKKGGKVIFFGNGGSAATCNHVSVDLTKNAKLKSINYNDPSMITCFANDYGFDQWIKKTLEFYCNKKKDLVVFISVSGNSPNLVNAAKWCKSKNVPLITLTGYSKDNKIKKINKKGLNIWVNSKSYNKVEIMHHIILLSIVDLIIGKTVYKPN